MVVRLFQMGLTSKWVAEWVYVYNVIGAAVDELCKLETNSTCHGTSPRIVVLTCNPFEILLCNTMVSGRDVRRPGRPSGMQWQDTWIVARVEVHLEGYCTSIMQILAATAMNDLLANDEVLRLFHPTLEVHIGLLEVTVENILVGGIGTRHWMQL